MGRVAIEICEASSEGSYPERTSLSRENFMQKVSERKSAAFDMDTDEVMELAKKKVPKIERAYTVFDFYKTEGPVVRIAKHKNFEYLTLLIISFNAIWIGVDTDRNKSLTVT